MKEKLFLDYCKNSTKPLQTNSSDEIRIVYVPSLMIPLIKDKFIELLQPIEQQHLNLISAKGLYDSCAKNDELVWCILRDNEIIACLTMKIINYELGTAFRVTNMGAKANTIVDIIHDIRIYFENYARKLGCHVFEFSGRPGWISWNTPSAGFSRRHVMYQKLLGTENV